jgi:hypothetical protein
MARMICMAAMIALSASSQELPRRTEAAIKEKLKSLAKAGKAAGKAQEGSLAALRRLNAYRYLCGVPYDVGLDDGYAREAAAAAAICEKIGRLDHHPPNPGMPAKDYELASHGAGNSNLGMGVEVARCVDQFMFDSDASNIAVVGHRRWCLDPAMQRTGFGASGRFSAMYSTDHGRASPPALDYVAYPPPGLFPAEMISPRHAWSISLNPDKFGNAQEGAVKVRMIRLRRGQLVPTSADGFSDSLDLDHFSVYAPGMGYGGGIAFRARNAGTDAGKRYGVMVTGLSDKDGAPKRILFAAEFF